MSYHRYKMHCTSASRIAPRIPSTSRLNVFRPTFRSAVVWMQLNQDALNMAVNLLQIYPTLIKQKMCERLADYISRVKLFNNGPSSKKQTSSSSSMKTMSSKQELKVPEIQITKEFDDDERRIQSYEKETNRIFICGDKTSEKWSALVVALSEHFHVRCSPNPESSPVIEVCRLLLGNDAFIFLMDSVTIKNESYLQQLRFAAEAGLRIFCIREPHFSLPQDLYFHHMDNDHNLGSSSVSFGKKRDSSESIRSHVFKSPESGKHCSEKAHLNEQKQLGPKHFSFNAINQSLLSVSSQSLPVGLKYVESVPAHHSRFGIKDPKYRISSAKSDSLLVGRSLQPSSPGIVPYRCILSAPKSRPSSLFKTLRPGFSKNSSRESSKDQASYHKESALLIESYRQALVYSRSSHGDSLEIILQSLEGHDAIDDYDPVVITDSNSVSNEHTSCSQADISESTHNSEYFFPFKENTGKGIKLESDPESHSTPEQMHDFSKETSKSKTYLMPNVDPFDTENHLDSGLSSPTDATTIYIVYPPHRSGQCDVPKIVRCPSENDMESLPSVGSSGFQDVDLSIPVNQLDWSSDESY
ncbi:hypothetical protein ACJMK2_037875 [Sinanodonta woodiana]|uniref:Uncharacterized protein n=1 Tax=Sinanodonta woodiana TaxID=1069815 RepID=A0ABD3WNY1_SINWO